MSSGSQSAVDSAWAAAGPHPCGGGGVQKVGSRGNGVPATDGALDCRPFRPAYHPSFKLELYVSRKSHSSPNTHRTAENLPFR
jgi:hypothetical protein